MNIKIHRKGGVIFIDSTNNILPHLNTENSTFLKKNFNASIDLLIYNFVHQQFRLYVSHQDLNFPFESLETFNAHQ